MRDKAAQIQRLARRCVGVAGSCGRKREQGRRGWETADRPCCEEEGLRMGPPERRYSPPSYRARSMPWPCGRRGAHGMRVDKSLSPTSSPCRSTRHEHCWPPSRRRILAMIGEAASSYVTPRSQTCSARPATWAASVW